MLITVILCRQFKAEYSWIFHDVLSSFLGVRFRLCFSNVKAIQWIFPNQVELSFGHGFIEQCQGIPGRKIPEWKSIAPEDLGLSERVGKSISHRIPQGILTLKPKIQAPWGFDLLGTIYFLLTRYEEVGFKDCDQHGRFSSKVCCHREHLRRPIVDEIMWCLAGLIADRVPDYGVPDPKFQILPSHDIDHPSIYLNPPLWRRCKDVARSSAVVQAGLCGLMGMFRVRDPRFDPYDTIDWILDESEKRGLKSAFYYIPEQTDFVRDPPVYLSSFLVRRQWKEIVRRGHEVGLHPGYQTCERPDAVARGKHLLHEALEDAGVETEIEGGRQHYLRWKTINTARNWESAGMSYDSTLGFADRVGFRCGTCFEYRMFDVEKRRALDLRQRPLIVMDRSLMDADCEGLGRGREALGLAKQLKDACQRVGGQFTILWHNTRLIRRDERRLYLKILDES